MRSATLPLTLTGTSPLVPAPQVNVRLEVVCLPRAGYVPPSPEAQAEADLVRTADGRPAIPADALKSALLQGVDDLGLPERHPLLPTWGDVLRRVLSFDTDPIVILGGGVVWSEPVVTRVAGAVPRGRYRFDTWSIKTVLNYPPDFISGGTLLRLAGIVGDAYGLGLFRPKMGGTHGRFTVEGEVVL